MQARPWERAFDASGLRGDQDAVAASVLRALELAGPPAIPLARPTAAALAPAFPRRCVVPYSLLWLPTADEEQTVPDAPPPLPPPDSPPEARATASERPWFGRTRSSSSAALAPSAAAASASTGAAASSSSAPAPVAAEPWPLTETLAAAGPRVPRGVRLVQPRVRARAAQSSLAQNSSLL